MADLSDDIRSLIQGGIDPVTFEEISDRRRRPHPGRRRMAGRVLSIAVVAAVAVPVILAVSSTHSAPTLKHSALRKSKGVAQRRVISTLDTTIASGSFDITFSQQASTAPATTTTTTAPPCDILTDPGPDGSRGTGGPETTIGDSPAVTAVTVPVAGCGGGTGAGLAISGQGTIDTDPFAMVVETEVPGLGQITLRDNGTDIWELGGGDYGLSPGSTDSGPGSSLPGFASLVEGTLGARQGASDMMVLANPTGYLELDADAISSANQTGTGTVDGVPVTVYQVMLDPDQEATVTGANADETQAIQNALNTLKQEGYTGTSATISVDAGGYIRRIDSTASFADGSSQTGETTFSDFGCAGTVLMPGQAGSSSPPAGCVSPDTAITTTTAPPA